jgi:hypothetical protein
MEQIKINKTLVTILVGITAILIWIIVAIQIATYY